MFGILSGKTISYLLFLHGSVKKKWILNKISVKLLQIISTNKLKFWLNFKVSLFCSSFQRITQIKTLKWSLRETGIGAQ